MARRRLTQVRAETLDRTHGCGELRLRYVDQLDARRLLPLAWFLEDVQQGFCGDETERRWRGGKRWKEAMGGRSDP